MAKAREGELSLRLRERWRSLEEQLDEASDEDGERLLSAKASWFSDAFDFLMKLPESEEGAHIWCDHPHLMGPLLETFHAFPFPFAVALTGEGEGDGEEGEEGAGEGEGEGEELEEEKGQRHQRQQLRLLWRRLCRELSRCSQCICQHHQALRSYGAEFEAESVRPLLRTLAALDEQRVSQQLRQLNARLRAKRYDPARDTALVATLMFEVLMFPVLLDDRSLANEFQIFIEAIDDAYQLTLSANQQYPVLCSALLSSPLLFFSALLYSSSLLCCALLFSSLLYTYVVHSSIPLPPRESLPCFSSPALRLELSASV